MPKKWVDCIECPNNFYITERDQEFYAQRGLVLPKRCFQCRQKNKREREESRSAQVDSTTNNSWQRPTDGPKDWHEVWTEPAKPAPPPRPDQPRKPHRSPVRKRG